MSHITMPRTGRAVQRRPELMAPRRPSQRFLKVVLFCGGLGARLREHSDVVPKPMVPIGAHPLLWHLMKYYAHFGHRQFILCLGYRGQVIKEYFQEYVGGMASDRWDITFAETAVGANVGQRLKAVEPYLEGEEMFLANYSDGLSDLDLSGYIEHFERHDAIGGFLSVRPHLTFHTVSFENGSLVTGIRDIRKSEVWINGGYFIFRRQIFDYIEAGDELVEEPFQRLIADRALITYPHDGFWACMDTVKDKQMLDHLAAMGQMPWAVWHRSGATEACPIASAR